MVDAVRSNSRTVLFDSFPFPHRGSALLPRRPAVMHGGGACGTKRNEVLLRVLAAVAAEILYGGLQDWTSSRMTDIFSYRDVALGCGAVRTARDPAAVVPVSVGRTPCRLLGYGVRVGPGLEICANHLQTISPRFVAIQHQSRRFNRLL